jgi:hypothetical protein
MTKNEFAQGLKCGIFANGLTMEEAYEVVTRIAKASDNPPSVYTAVHVMLNAIAEEIPNLS